MKVCPIVEAANSLYERAFKFALMLVTLGHIITIENPTRSWLWELPIIMALLECCFFVHLHACMFGGARKKKTSLLTNESMFESLSVFCDGSHEHAPWGIDENNEFNTAKEAQYPQGFCEAYCQVLARLMNTRVENVDSKQLYRPFSQPRGRKVAAARGVIEILLKNGERLSRMIWAIGVTELRLPWVNYFDDYPILTPSEISASTMAAAKGMLKLLGFGFAENKLEPFATSAEVLGVVVDCGLVSEGKLVYAMKESRRQEALSAIEDILDKGAVTPCLLPSVLGRLEFADGQLAGRTGKLAMADIRSLGLHSKSSVSLDSDARVALQMLKERFMDNRPRTIVLSTEECPLLLYTDGSYEPGVTSEVAMIGGVLLDGTAPARVFGSHVPKDLLARWHNEGKEHLIGQVEMYAVAVARDVWKERLHNRRGIIFIDNWPVLDCYIPGTAKQKTWREILLSIERVDKEFPSQLWATRVPSESNIADPPSRGTLEPIRFLGQLLIDEPKCPMTGQPLETCLG
ncbi:unnamed protein product [Cladocopium goreaui]|uniref:Reverse transcriptase domain-containing protein n=1 Tax=Cladocopium goreaui TaxID=2562237 RepID=A0A9P1D0S7_9DINO|nr:unnamed protein product [Cladocopium goreaui]